MYFKILTGTVQRNFRTKALGQLAKGYIKKEKFFNLKLALWVSIEIWKYR